jgi:K+-transporting ATPase ATPase C chain
MITQNGQLVGSELVAQKFTSNRYFWPRPSASDYNATPSYASYLGLTSARLQHSVQERKKILEAFGNDVPSELIYTSASGIDPHISPQCAYFQINRIAEARFVTPDQLRRLIQSSTLRSFLGPPRINVLQLNMTLDQMEEKKT